MNVLVTGAFGNIGSHSVDALLKLTHASACAEPRRA